MEQIHKEAGRTKVGRRRQERTKKERKEIKVGECTLQKETHSIPNEGKPILPKQSTNKRDGKSTKQEEGTKEER